MPRALVRPPRSEIAAIQSALMKHNDATLPPAARCQLRMVLSWAEDRTFREVAKVEGCGRSAVQRAVQLYREKGLDGFVGAKPPRKGGRPPIPDRLRESIVSALRMHVDEGIPPPYRRIAAEHGVSLGVVAKLAKAKGLDAARRRGRVANTATPGTGVRAP